MAQADSSPSGDRLTIPAVFVVVGEPEKFLLSGERDYTIRQTLKVGHGDRLISILISYAADAIVGGPKC